MSPALIERLGGLYAKFLISTSQVLCPPAIVEVAVDVVVVVEIIDVVGPWLVVVVACVVPICCVVVVSCVCVVVVVSVVFDVQPAKNKSPASRMIKNILAVYFEFIVLNIGKK